MLLLVLITFTIVVSKPNTWFYPAGIETTITVNVHIPTDFPVDLYYLTDVSRSIKKESVMSLGQLLGNYQHKVVTLSHNHFQLLFYFLVLCLHLYWGFGALCAVFQNISQHWLLLAPLVLSFARSARIIKISLVVVLGCSPNRSRKELLTLFNVLIFFHQLMIYQAWLRGFVLDLAFSSTSLLLLT